MLKPLTVWIPANRKTPKGMGVPDPLTCLLRNLYAGQEATVRTLHGMTDWFKIGEEVWQGCILAPCLFNFYAEYIRQNARLDESQAGIKTSGRNSSASDMQMYHSNGRNWKGTNDLLSLWGWKSEKVGLKLNIQKQITASCPNTSWQIQGEKVEAVRFSFLGLQKHHKWWLQPWNSKTLAPWKESYHSPIQNSSTVT